MWGPHAIVAKPPINHFELLQGDYLSGFHELGVHNIWFWSEGGFSDSVISSGGSNGLFSIFNNEATFFMKLESFDKIL